MSKYFAIRAFVENFPSVIDNSAVFTITEKISETLQCSYNNLGYRLLHPDYDFKEIGIMFPNNSFAKERFSELSIPIIYQGKYNYSAAPFITFELTPHNDSSLSDYSIVFRYPEYDTSPLVFVIDVKAELLNKPISINQYSDIINLLTNNGYLVNSAFTHHYSGSTKRAMFDGGQIGLCTFEEMSLINKAVRYQGANYKNKLMDIYIINSISLKAISSVTMNEICSIVGESNVFYDNSVFTFALPQSSTNVNAYKIKIRKLLNREGLII